MQSIVYTLKRDGFVIVPDSIYSDVEVEMKKQKISTKYLYKQSEKSFTDIVDFGENDPSKDFVGRSDNGQPKLYKK